MNLPDIEVVSAEVHAAWMDSKRAQGVTTRKAEDGEELMAPYAELSEKAKELDRGTVRAVYSAIERAGTPEPSEGFDVWMQNPYTKVLMQSIERDYVPRAASGVTPCDGGQKS